MPRSFFSFSMFLLLSACSSNGGQSVNDSRSGVEIRSDRFVPDEDDVATIDTESADITSTDVILADLVVPKDIGEISELVEDGPDVGSTDKLSFAGPLASQQRGPLVLDFVVEQMAGLKEYDVFVDWQSADGEFNPCTALTGYSDDSLTGIKEIEQRRFVWDSMADIQADINDVRLRLRVFLSGTPVELFSGSFSLFNDPARVRQVLLTHAINGDNRVRQLSWTHDNGLGAVGGDPAGEVHTIGTSPRRVTFSPNGRFAAIIEEGNETLRMMSFDLLTGTLLNSRVEDVPGMYPVDIEFAGDGARLFIVNSSPDADGGLYQVPFDAQEGGFVSGETPQQIHSQYVPGDLELLPDGRGLAMLAADPGGNMNGIYLLVMDLLGEVLGETGIGPEGSSSRNVTASPDGSRLLVTYSNLFGNGERVVLVNLDSTGHPTVAGDMEVEGPEEAVFASDSVTALVTEAMNNKVTGLSVSGPVLTKGTSFKAGLAARVAHTRWGPDRDIFLITTVSSSTGQSGLAVAELGSGGQVTNLGTYEIGDGIDKIPGDVAVQP
jgi:hypothetical protein